MLLKGKLSMRIRSWLSCKHDQHVSKLLLNAVINEEDSKVARHLVQRELQGPHMDCREGTLT